MKLAALIAAYHESGDPAAALRATLPLAGRTLVERQARLAAAAGAKPVVMLVERLPAEILAAIDRMRAEGIDLVVARSVGEAADAIEPDARLLLMADGVIASKDHIARLTETEGAALLTIPDLGADDRFERIDAQSRWAGLGVIDGALLKQTAAMLQDWDLQSTLLRRSVQAGARQLALRGEPADAQLTIAETSADLAAVQARILESASEDRGDWPSRYLLAPLEQAATRALMPTAVTSDMVGILAALLTGLGAFFFAREWLWAGMLVLILATPLDGIAERLATLRMEGSREKSWWNSLLPFLAGAALLALGHTLSEENGWGCLLLAVTIIAFIVALRVEKAGKRITGSSFLPERKGMTWALLPFAVTGLWTTGLGLLALYAAGSFFWVQRQVHGPSSGPAQD